MLPCSCRWPKTAVFLTALLWLVVALFMLIGTGA